MFILLGKKTRVHPLISVIREGQKCPQRCFALKNIRQKKHKTRLYLLCYHSFSCNNIAAQMNVRKHGVVNQCTALIKIKEILTLIILG